jgi:hypothetical protein
VVWRDVELDVLGVAPPAASGVAGQSADLVVASPSAETYAALRCGSTAAEGGVLVGEVVDLQGARRAGVEVRAAWGRLLLGRSENRNVAQQVADTTDASGRYALCGLPRSASVGVDGTRRSLVSGDITLSASGPGLSAGPIIVELEGQGALRRDIVAGVGMRVRLEGRVLGVNGVPLVGAAVSVAGTVDERPARTDSTGGWALDSVPVQTTEIGVRALGYIPARMVLDPQRGRLAGDTIQMERIPQDLEATVIVGQRTTARRDAFERRRSAGVGTFLDEDVLNRMILTPGGLRARVGRSNAVGSGPLQRFVLESQSIMGAAVCDPLWFVDGMSFGRVTGDEQQMLLRRAKMLEVYRGYETPIDYIDFDGCGAVVVWTDDR